MFFKLAPIIIALGFVIGAFFYGVSVGKDKQKIVYQDRIIKTGERHVDIEKRQSVHTANRGQRLHIERLRKASF